MRDQKSIENQSVYVTIKGRTEPLHVIPEGIQFKKDRGWILNSYDVSFKREHQITLSDVVKWENV